VCSEQTSNLKLKHCDTLAYSISFHLCLVSLIKYSIYVFQLILFKHEIPLTFTVQKLWIVIMCSWHYLICWLFCRIVLKLYPLDLDLGTNVVVYIQMLQTVSRYIPNKVWKKILQTDDTMQMYILSHAIVPNIVQMSNFITQFISIFSVNACLWLG